MKILLLVFHKSCGLVGHVIYSFFRIKSLFMDLVWFCSVSFGYGYRDLHFVQDFHLFIIKWQTPRNISAYNFRISTDQGYSLLLSQPNFAKQFCWGWGGEGGSYLEIMCCMMKAGYVKLSKYGHLCVHGIRHEGCILYLTAKNNQSETGFINSICIHFYCHCCWCISQYCCTK